LKVKALIFGVAFTAISACNIETVDVRYAAQTRINPVTDEVFEVVTISSRGTDFWCGASDYARRVLGGSWADRLYVARGMGPSVTTNRRSAVHFTLNPNAVGTTSGTSNLSINSFSVGDSMSVQRANMFCGRFNGRI